jgi:hypothetical protein
VHTIIAACEHAVSEHKLSLPLPSFSPLDVEKITRERERTKESSRTAIRKAAAYNQHLSLVPLPPISLDEILRNPRDVNPLPYGPATVESLRKGYDETLPVESGPIFTELL